MTMEASCYVCNPYIVVSNFKKYKFMNTLAILVLAIYVPRRILEIYDLELIYLTMHISMCKRFIFLESHVATSNNQLIVKFIANTEICHYYTK